MLAGSGIPPGDSERERKMAVTNEKEERSEEWLVEETSLWDLKIPLGLLIFGLLVLVIHGFATAGVKGGGGVFLDIGILLVVYLPLTILAMFIAAPLLDVTFGEFGPAVLKIAGLFMFTAGLLDVGSTVGHPVLGWIVAYGASLFLYSKVFSLTAMETIGAVLVVAVVRGLLTLAIGSLISH
jgi:hypothetical protein